MPIRMLCTDCFRVSIPGTLLHGSDVAEAVAWCFFALPGWVYCWWRHLNRIKVCPECGSRELMRETRAAAARNPWDDPSGDALICNVSGQRFWPAPLSSPRSRLRSGIRGTLPPSAALIFGILGIAGVLTPESALALMGGCIALTAGWLISQGVRVTSLRAALERCRASDSRGRPLRIQIL
jgi:hypothetical protein